MCAYFKFASQSAGMRFGGRLAGWAALLMLVATDASAIDLLDGQAQVHGFLTQGIVLTSDNNFLGKSEKGSLDFREIGINLTYRPATDWHISGQLLSHRTGELDDGHIRLDYGMVDWTAISSEQGRMGVRLGRIKHPFGLYNETRDVAFTRPSAILPQPIYFEQARNLEMSSDGMALYLERFGEMGTLNATWGIGYANVGEKSVEAAFLGRDDAGKLDSKPVQLLNLLYEGDNGRYRLGLTSAWGHMDYKPQAGALLGEGSVSYHPVIVSAQYNWDRWSLTGEYFLEYLHYRDYGPMLPDQNRVAQSYYLQGAWRFAADGEAFLRYDTFYADKHDRDGSKMHAATGLPSFMAYAKSWVVGARYDVNPQFMVRAEFHRVHGTGWLSSLENRDPAGLSEHWNMLILMGSWRF